MVLALAVAVGVVVGAAKDWLDIAVVVVADVAAKVIV